MHVATALYELPPLQQEMNYLRDAVPALCLASARAADLDRIQRRADAYLSTYLVKRGEVMAENPALAALLPEEPDPGRLPDRDYLGLFAGLYARAREELHESVEAATTLPALRQEVHASAARLLVALGQNPKEHFAQPVGAQLLGLVELVRRGERLLDR